VLYGAEIDNDTLFTIDLDNGASSTVGFLDAQIEGLAFDRESGRFLGVNNSNHTLSEISLDPFSSTTTQDLTYGTHSAFARNPLTGIYYSNFNSLSIVDPLTGTATPISSSVEFYTESLAFDSAGNLFGIGNVAGSEYLYEIDISTAAILSTVEITSSLLNPGFGNSLAIDPLTGAFFTVAAIEGGLYEIDPSTGAAARIGNTGERNIRALDFAVFDVPEPPNPVPEPVAIDIKPGSCPNSLNSKSKGVLPVAILGTAEFDVNEIDPATVRLAGVAPLRWDFEDVATPYEPFTGKQDCTFDCTEMGPDGYMDATLKFDTQEVIAALGEAVLDGACLVAQLTGNLRESFGGTEIVGEDVIRINCKGN
jgi:hypothetical protein